MNRKTIFITGVAGFIGSNCAEGLLRQGHRVVGIDNFAPAYPRAKKEANLKSLEQAAKNSTDFQFFEADLRNAARLKEILSSEEFGGILHLGALAGVQPSLNDPASYFEVNVMGTLNLFEAARSQEIRSMVMASSSSVYGGNTKLPFAESDPVEKPLSPYAASKRSTELLAYSYHHLHGFHVAAMRFFTVYGPRQRPDLAIYKFVRAILKGETLTLYGDGSSSRDYTFIEDCVSGILQALEWVQPPKEAKPRYEIFNLGESQTVKLNELVALLEQTLQKKAKVQYAPYLPGDVYATWADLSHVQKVLGYQPKTNIQAGIEKFCDWYLKEEQGKPWG